MGPAEGREYCQRWTKGRENMENSRVDGMVGGGGGRSACVITREDKGLVSLQAADVAATEQAVTFCLYSVCIVQCM